MRGDGAGFLLVKLKPSRCSLGLGLWYLFIEQKFSIILKFAKLPPPDCLMNARVEARSRFFGRPTASG
jgi:hypothetical protein